MHLGYSYHFLKTSYSLGEQVHEVVGCGGVRAEGRAHDVAGRVTPTLVPVVGTVRGQRGRDGLSVNYLTWGRKEGIYYFLPIECELIPSMIFSFSIKFDMSREYCVVYQPTGGEYCVVYHYQPKKIT